MGELAQILGVRLREYRVKAGLTQEALAEKAEMHPTYIGQVERGEKNLSIASLARITGALEVPLSELFADIEELACSTESVTAVRAYELLNRHSPQEQEKLYAILQEIESLMK